MSMLAANTHAATLHEFAESELMSATNNYTTLVGTGALGSVYKGSLQHADVVVKILDPVSIMSLFVLHPDIFVSSPSRNFSQISLGKRFLLNCRL